MQLNKVTTQHAHAHRKIHTYTNSSEIIWISKTRSASQRNLLIEIERQNALCCPSRTLRATNKSETRESVLPGAYQLLIFDHQHNHHTRSPSYPISISLSPSVHLSLSRYSCLNRMCWYVASSDRHVSMDVMPHMYTVLSLHSEKPSFLLCPITMYISI